MIYRFLPFLSVFLFTSCASVIDQQKQDVRIETPGAQHASCDLFVEKLRYRYHPPETVNIINSRKDLTVKCLAPGNREKEITVSPKITDSTFYNVTNGVVPGVAWDSLSGAMYEYPDVIKVDFTNIPVKPMPLPAYHDPNIKQPSEYNLEEFLPTSPLLNSDKYKKASPLKRRKIPKSSHSQRYGEVEESMSVAPVSGAVEPASEVQQANGIVSMDDVIRNLQGNDIPVSPDVSTKYDVVPASNQPATVIPLPVANGTIVNYGPDAPLPLTITPSPSLNEAPKTTSNVPSVVIQTGPAIDEPASLMMGN